MTCIPTDIICIVYSLTGILSKVEKSKILKLHRKLRKSVTPKPVHMSSIVSRSGSSVSNGLLFTFTLPAIL